MANVYYALPTGLIFLEHNFNGLPSQSQLFMIWYIGKHIPSFMTNRNAEQAAALFSPRCLSSCTFALQVFACSQTSGLHLGQKVWTVLQKAAQRPRHTGRILPLTGPAPSIWFRPDFDLMGFISSWAFSVEDRGGKWVLGGGKCGSSLARYQKKSLFQSFV